MVILTDREVAVIIDALSQVQATIAGPSPNIDSALQKVCSLVTPATTGIEMTAVSA